MVYELRVYEAMPGRLPDLLRRFEQHTLGFFAQHGIRLVGMWTTVAGPSANQLTYILAYADLADRERRWTAFATDPAWLAARAASEQNGPLVARISNQFLAPAAFAPQP